LLVGGIPTHLKNVKVQLGWLCPIWKNQSSKPPTSSFGIYKGSIFQGECNCWAAHPPLNLTVNPDLVAIKFRSWKSGGLSSTSTDRVPKTWRIIPRVLTGQ
jgi:hypothetical protein